MIKSPAFQFYPADYLASQRVQMMTLEEEGAYIRLLCYCWLHGSIPDDDAQIARLISKGATTTLATTVKAMFNQHTTDSKLIHDRLDHERVKQSEWSRKSSEGGKKSAEIRKGGSRVVQPPYQPNGNITSTSTSSSTITTTIDKENTLLASTSHGESKQKVKTKRAYSITWNPESHFQGITEENRKLWSTAFPAVNIDMQLAGMTTWLLANPAKAHKSNWPKFMNDWLKRQQDKGGDIQSNKSTFAQSKPATYHHTAGFVEMKEQKRKEQENGKL